MSNAPEPVEGDDPGFLAWRRELPFFDLDGERFYLPTGDIPMDEDQIRQVWERRRPDEVPDS